MLENRTRVLLILSGDVLDQARVLAGKLTVALKLPVSLQIVLRALIEEGLKRADERTVIADIGRQARAVRELRGQVRRRTAGTATRRTPSARQRLARDGRRG
jgi:hypothetical protein